MIRNHRHSLDENLRSRLRSVRLHISDYLDGESNVEVLINIPDALYEPIKYRSGNGENQLTIDIDHYGVNYSWTRRTYTKRAKEFFSGVVKKVTGFFGSIFRGIKSISGSVTKAIGWH